MVGIITGSIRKETREMKSPAKPVVGPLLLEWLMAR